MGIVYAVPTGHPNYLTIVYKDVFHLKSLYVMMYEYLQDQGWESCQGPWEHYSKGNKGDGKVETLFYDSRDPGNKKLNIWWRLQRPAGNKYFHYFMNVNFLFLGWKNVEVMWEGEKMKAQKGELSIFIRPWFEYDYGGKWEDHPILKHFHQFFKDRIFKDDFDAREDELLHDAYRFQQMIRNFLEQRSFMPDREAFFPARKETA